MFDQLKLLVSIKIYFPNLTITVGYCTFFQNQIYMLYEQPFHLYLEYRRVYFSQTGTLNK